MLSFSKTDFIFGILCKTQLEQQAEVTDFLTKFHILMSFLWSLVYYTQYEINTVVHLRQIFIENLGAQETAKKKPNKHVFVVTRYFIFISSYLYLTFMILNNYR